VTTFQFDECFNDKRIVDKCNADRLCEVLPYPRALKGKKDHEMLPIILNQPTPLVTKDFRILDQNKRSIPSRHPGVIVLKSQKASDTFTTSDAAKNLAKFKSRFASWHTTDWRDLFLEIDEVCVCIFNVIDDYASAIIIEFSDEDFSGNVDRAIRKLSAKKISP
jgi:hypothetical protein